MKKIIIATSNKNKIKEMKDFLSTFFDEVLSLDDVKLNIDAIEDGSSFLENSLIKGKDISLKTDIPVLSDDSGLSINCLGGFPGIYSARFMEDKSYKEKCLTILDMMKDKKDRTAFFSCALTFIDKKRNIQKQFLAKAEGEIVKEYHEYEYGFGYDPIFFSYEANAIFASINPDEKFKYSHRGKANRMLIEFLKENYK